MNKQKKLKISEKATGRYVENNRFTIRSLAEEMNMDSSEIYELFPNRKSILLYFYESRLLLYNKQKESIDGYENFSLHEKLSNLFLTLLDQFMEYREFVTSSYYKLICKSAAPTNFEKKFKLELKSIFESDQNLSTVSRIILNQFFYKSIYIHFHGLIYFWANDDSETYEQSYALVDKWCSLIEEIFYNKILDKGFDFGRFLFYNSPFKNLITPLNNEHEVYK